MSLKAHFGRFLGAHPERLHFAAHSHHPWPDVSFEAQQRAWLEAAEHVDDKWARVFGEVIPAAQGHLARLLNLPDPATLCFAPSTHELLMRLWSTLEPPVVRLLTTDAEFHSLARQVRRLEEAGRCIATRVPVEPFETFEMRFAEAAARGGHDLVCFSHVFFNSGLAVRDPAALVDALPDRDTPVVIDGYHAVMALPVDLGRLAARVFYVGGGYKYAMAGEGAAWMHCPPACAPRPMNTGWFAGFGQLSAAQPGTVAYAEGGQRFMGATFDPTALYRFNAVMDWVRGLGLTPAGIHAQVLALQGRFLDGLAALPRPPIDPAWRIPPGDLPRGNFLVFRTPLAGALNRALAARAVMTDYRDDRLRIGFGLYHEPADVDALLGRLAALAQRLD